MKLPAGTLGLATVATVFAFSLFVHAQIGSIQKSATIKKPTLIRIIKTKEELIAFVETLNGDLAKMNEYEQSIYAGFVKLGVESRKLSEATNAVARAAGGNSQSQLINATKQMQEIQMSFNLQYLQLQNSMQNENRQFKMASNILKTKHDTVKNSISNVR